MTDRDAVPSYAERTASQSESDLDRRVGPFYDDAGLLAHFEMTGSEVDDLVRSSEVLRVASADDEYLYPTYQFGADGALLPRLRDVIEGLDPDFLDPWGDTV